jgi:hypothetical protein
MCTVVIPRMNRKHAIALGAVLAASIVAWVLLHWTPAPRVQSAISGASSLEPADRDDWHAVDPRAVRAEPVTAAAIAADAENSARLWMARADTVARAKKARMFNEDVARMMALPADEAWAALVHAARDGDLAASAAALLVAQECGNQLDRAPTQDAEAKRAIDRATAEPLPSDWAGFLRALDARQQERLRAHIERCALRAHIERRADVGGVLDFALIAMDRAMRPDDPQTLLAEASEIVADDEAIAALRSLASTEDNAAARSALGQRLMRSRNLQEQHEGRAMLEQLASGDPDIVDFLAACFSHGCGGFGGDSEVADAWVERAAGMGSRWALAARVGTLETTGNAAGAWAWALYRLDLARLGCFEQFQPQWTWIAQAAQDVFRLQAALSPAQQAAGRAAADAIAMRWLASATVRYSCG